MSLLSDAHYKEENIFLDKKEFEFVQIVEYRGAIDAGYDLLLFMKVLDRDSLAEGKSFDVKNDSTIIKCNFDVQSVWNWERENVSMQGTIKVVEIKRKKIKLQLKVEIQDLKRNRIYIYDGEKIFLRSLQDRPTYWNTY